MKPERRGSFINRSFRRSFRRKKDDEDEKSPEEIKAEREAALLELQKAVVDISDADLSGDHLERALRARNYDVKEAEKLFRLHANSKKILLLETFSEEVDVPEVVKQFNFCGFLGFDKEGSAIRVVNLGCGDLRGFIHAISTLQLLKLMLYYMHEDIKRMKKENEKTGRNAEQILYVIDMEHFATSQFMFKPVLDSALLLLKLFQDFFYDISKDVLVINAPSYFSTVYKLLKPVIQDTLHKKIKVYGNDKWQEILLEKVSPDVLPESYGGTRKDSKGDPKCSEFISYGGEIPQAYIKQEQITLDPNDPDVHTIVVGAGAFHNLPLQVKHAGTVFVFHVMSKEHDISVGLFYEPPSIGFETPKTKKKSDQKELMSKMEQLIPNVRAQCHLRPVIGYTKLWKVGTYVLHLDNTYSWMNPKEVYYKLEIRREEKPGIRSAV